MPEQQFQTDLNDRERKRFAERFRSMSKLAADAANALETGDDTSLLVPFLMLSMSSGAMRELGDVITAAAEKEKAMRREEVPDVIGD